MLRSPAKDQRATNTMARSGGATVGRRGDGVEGFRQPTLAREILESCRSVGQQKTVTSLVTFPAGSAAIVTMRAREFERMEGRRKTRGEWEGGGRTAAQCMFTTTNREQKVKHTPAPPPRTWTTLSIR